MANNNLAVVQQSTSKAFNPHPVGTMLMDRFKVLKTLGKGSFGVALLVNRLRDGEEEQSAGHLARNPCLVRQGGLLNIPAHRRGTPPGEQLDEVQFHAPPGKGLRARYPEGVLTEQPPSRPP